MAHWLFLPTDAIEDIETVSKLSGEDLTRLRDFLDSNDFRPRYAFYTKVADLLDISDESAAKLCNFISHVQTQRAKQERSGADVSGELAHFLGKVMAEDNSQGPRAKKLIEFVREHQADLARLFSDLREHDFF